MMTFPIVFEISYPAGKDKVAWNKRFGLNAYYAGKHYQQRKQDAEELHWMAIAAMRRARIRKDLAREPVEICFFWDDGLDVDNHAAIGKAVGRSEKCVRSKIYNDYLTENMDKVREMLGDGPWGSGAPEMDVKHGFYISHTRQQVRRDLSALAALLRKRMNDLGYDPYWQRFMCMNWDDIGGCSAGCKDCDSCTEFRRIPPQYCARCGAAFYERKENRFCSSCRQARKKQAQRHWCRVNVKAGG